MLSWLADVERIPATKAGGSWDDVPWRIVLHSTEGGSIGSAVGAYREHGSWPHLTVDPATRRIVQHYPFSVSARALKHPAGTPGTNTFRAIQIEIVGYAAKMADLPVDQVQWLGQAVVGPIARALSIPLLAPAIWPAYPASYGLRAPQRMSRAAWRDFAGVCAHMHVPDNDHGDVGALFVTAVLDAAAQPNVPRTPNPEEDDELKATYVKRADHDEVYLAGPFDARHVTLFKSAEFVANRMGIVIVPAPADGAVDISDGDRESRKVWVVDEAGAELFGLPDPP